MSVDRLEWIQAVFSENGPKSHAERVVLGVIFTFMSGTKQVAWPSQETIAKRARVSRRHAQRLLKDLEADGWISVEPLPQKGRGRGWRLSLYRPSIPSGKAERSDIAMSPPHHGEPIPDRVERGDIMGSPPHPEGGDISHPDMATSETRGGDISGHFGHRGGDIWMSHESSIGESTKEFSNGEREQTSRAPAAGKLPLGWQPAAETRAEMRDARPDLNLDAELVQFRDYYQSRGDSRADWDAAFRVWVRRAKSTRKGNGAGHRPKTADEIREEQEAFQAFEASMTPEDVEDALADAKRIGFRPQRPDESQARYVFAVNDAAYALDVIAFKNLGIDRSPSYRPLEEAIPDRKLRAQLIEKRTTELRREQRRVVV